MSTVTVAPGVEDAPALRSTVYALTGGTFLLALGLASLVWVWGSLSLVGGLTSFVGVLAVTLLALLLFAYGWALVVRGLTDVVARGVAEGMAR